MFDNIITQEMKNIFNSAIDSLLKENSLSISATLNYSQNTTAICPNCEFDPISNRSANRYNGVGTDSFAEGQICPVCHGFGYVETTSSENVAIGVIFDQKHFINIDKANMVNIPNGSIQTICSNIYYSQLRSADNISFVISKEIYSYKRSSSPTPMGFGDTNYVVMLWERL